MRKVLYLAVISLLAFSCKPDGDSTSGAERLNVEAFLLNAADNLIIPAYQQVDNDVQDLVTAVNTFTADLSEANLIALRTSWQTAMLSWQAAAPYNFGPAEDNSFRTILEDIATFPINSTKVEQYIAAGDTSMNNFDRDSRGFSSLDYLLNKGTNADVIASYDDNRKAYLRSVVRDISSRISHVKTTWETSYRDQFVSNTATSAGSSISFYYNEFVKSFEFIKKYKLALPAGQQIGQSTPDPTLLEVYYDDDFALELLKKHLTVVENIWYSRTESGNDGIGLDDLCLSQDGGQALHDNTVTSMAQVWQSVNALTNLKSDIENNLPLVVTSVEMFQRHTRYYKSDLSILLGISITFSDGDGD
ncbi:imelysin family protein [Cyclobacteriaceae bacterium]|nr:imelysin family protein [Cyclobacteriaceae bacterium]